MSAGLLNFRAAALRFLSPANSCHRLSSLGPTAIPETVISHKNVVKGASVLASAHVMQFATVLLVVCLVPLLKAAEVNKTVHVSNGQALVDAIRDDGVTSIILDKNVRFEPEYWPATAYRLERNLTVTSDPSGDHKVIDFNPRAVKGKLSIGAGFNLSFIHLTLKDTRYGAGADIDILAPSPNGIIFLHDLAKLQHSCPPLVKKAILAYVRDPSVPGVNNITFPELVEWDGKNYTGSILYNDFSTRMASGENLYESGYVVHKIHSYKLCDKVVSPECIAASDAATCVRQDMDAEYFANHPQQAAGQLSTAAKAGIGVAAGIAAAAVLATAAALILRRRRLQAHKDKLPVHGKFPGADMADDPKTYKHVEPKQDGQQGMKQVVVFGSNGSSLTSTMIGTCRNSNDTSMVDGSNITSLRSLNPALSGSSLLQMMNKVPEILRGTMSKEEAASITLGTMVGAGSFGRVFHGSLADKEVAVKVINHSGQNAKQVANEVELMMKFDHPNLVRAFHYVTWGTSGVSLTMTRSDHVDRTMSDCVLMSNNSYSSSTEGTAPSARMDGMRMVETWVISEYCNAGNLQDAVMLHNGGVFFANSVPQMGIMLRTLLGVSNAMEWLHQRNTLHGDLKCANVMLHVNNVGGAGETSTEEPTDDLELVPKVVDFGLSRVITQGATHLSTHTFGTITHQPPELMRSGRLSKPADVYSFGVLMWETIMAAHPWTGRMMGEIMTAVMIEGKRLSFAATVPQAFAHLAERCWQEDPASRPTFAEISAQLELLLNKEDELQEEVNTAYSSVINSAVKTWGADD